VVDQRKGAALPDPVSFDSPPVTEVILGVEFSGPVISEAGILADFWNQIRDEFPDVQKRPQFSPMAETFELPPQPPQPQIEFLLGEGGGPQRYAFRNETQNLTVQVQEDRFALTWEQASPSEEYPRYRWIREQFRGLYSTFLEAAEAPLLREHLPTWCATTYTNDIEHPDSSDPMHGPLEDIVRFVRRPDSDVLPPVEDTTIRQRRLLRDTDGNPIGRLYIRAIPTLSSPPESRPGYKLVLRVVAKPSMQDEAGVIARQDESRELIVCSFKDITTDKMHSKWGLRED
jgi:uncharacterized protein (TIGR04255 family)